jgi:hypothetical protein
MINFPHLKKQIMKSSILILLGCAISLSSFAQPLALARVGKLFGYIDQSGNMVVNPQYVNAKSFSDSRAAVLVNKKWGFIDRSGRMVIDPIYDAVKPFDNGIAIVAKDKVWRYIDDQGRDITNFPVSDKLYDFSEGLAIFRSGKNIGVFDTKGNIVVQAVYEEIKPYRNGYAKAKKYGRWGYLDRNGNEVVAFDYDDLGSYTGGATWGKKGTAFGVISNGNFKIVERCNAIWDFSEDGLAYARIEQAIGFIDANGNWVIQPQFLKARDFVNGLAPVCFNKLWGYINVRGEWIVQPLYPDAEVFSKDGLAPVKVKQWGFIDRNGKMVIPPNYEITVGGFQIFNFNEKGFVNGFARVKSSSGWAFIDTSGNVLGNRWYSNLELFR